MERIYLTHGANDRSRRPYGRITLELPMAAGDVGRLLALAGELGFIFDEHHEPEAVTEGAGQPALTSTVVRAAAIATEYLHIDGAHHKQHALERVIETLGGELPEAGTYTPGIA